MNLQLSRNKFKRGLNPLENCWAYAQHLLVDLEFLPAWRLARSDFLDAFQVLISFAK